MIKLAILCPTLIERREYASRMVAHMAKQIQPDVVVLFNEDNREKTTGQKRNELIQQAVDEQAQYIAFFDDDDIPGKTYIERQLEVVASGSDCGELWGQIYWSGVKGKPFHHSIIHKKWWEDDKFYYRCPNHLNCLKLDVVKDFKFPEQVFGEDGKWSMAIRDAGVLKTEHPIKDIIYHYFCGSPNHFL